MIFADIMPGVDLGESEFRLTDAEIAEWTSLFPCDAAALPVMPRAMVAMVVMRAFMAIMHDRPKGNIHAEQSTAIAVLPSIGDVMTTRLRSIEKTLKNGRRWITFESETVRSCGTLLFRGRMKMLWGA
jgi:hypothetical protein